MGRNGKQRRRQPHEQPGYLRIATEESFATKDMLRLYVELLDQPTFWPVLEAAEALNVPIYLHPNTPSKQKELRHPISHYPRNNVHINNSGVATKCASATR